MPEALNNHLPFTGLSTLTPLEELGRRGLQVPPGVRASSPSSGHGGSLPKWTFLIIIIIARCPDFYHVIPNNDHLGNQSQLLIRSLLNSTGKQFGLTTFNTVLISAFQFRSDRSRLARQHFLIPDPLPSS
ncbi:hypothetical protein PtA15_3A584 [Puccinia triticina]|uniref:Uncharacterized protein n=1 Tax=Puccinia triticina TaxID=208348 RepID=A0ABY7CDN0_9BASI|nr:uncharacterized protein PtA15_3A584 [Puccinia triticina]WAQ83215.1 hypothetical protein PtA15_3A584 [Puccinia triticina]